MVGLLAHVCPPAPAGRRENRAPHSARHARLEVPVSLREHHERKPANYWVDAGRTGKDQKARVLHEPQFFTGGGLLAVLWPQGWVYWPNNGHCSACHTK